STLGSEEQLHRAAWGIELALRHGRMACAAPDRQQREAFVRERVAGARATFAGVFARHGDAAPARLRDASLQYRALADEGLANDDTCRLLSSPALEARRAALDEEMTDAWIDRLQELHADVKATEDRARGIGQRTAMS